MLNLPDKDFITNNCRIFPKNSEFPIYSFTKNGPIVLKQIQSWNLFRQLTVLHTPEPFKGFARCFVSVKEPEYYSYNAIINKNDFYNDPGLIEAIEKMSIGDVVDFCNEKWIIKSDVTPDWQILIETISGKSMVVSADHVTNYPAPIHTKSKFTKEIFE